MSGRMCGRTALTSSPEELREVFGLDEAPAIAPHYNVPPSQLLAAIRTPGKLEWLRWGLVPFWAVDPKIGHRLALARAETVCATAAFRDAVRRRRCLVVVSGFYEWQRTAKNTSRPFFVRRADSSPFALAGVWDKWVSADGEVVESCAIVTAPAKPPVDAVHGRMPLVLGQKAWSAWLDRTTSDVGELLAAPPDGLAALVAFPVSPYVNDPRHDDPRCLRMDPAGQQAALFP